MASCDFASLPGCTGSLLFPVYSEKSKLSCFFSYTDTNKNYFSQHLTVCCISLETKSQCESKEKQCLWPVSLMGLLPPSLITASSIQPKTPPVSTHNAAAISQRRRDDDQPRYNPGRVATNGSLHEPQQDAALNGVIGAPAWEPWQHNMDKKPPHYVFSGRT